MQVENFKTATKKLTLKRFIKFSTIASSCTSGTAAAIMLLHSLPTSCYTVHILFNKETFI